MLKFQADPRNGITNMGAMMRCFAFLLAIVLLPAVVMADALATSICVLDRTVYEKLVKEYGQPAKIPTGVLWSAAAHTGFLKDSCDTTFKWENASYRLLASRRQTGEQGERTIYSISQELEGKPSRLICVGTAGADEVKKDAGDDVFVVVLREGNFLKR